MTMTSMFDHKTERLARRPVLHVLAGLAACALLAGCLGMPERAQAVTNFSLESYLGTWYEIARLDHSFERGLSHVQAQYSLREDGGVEVVNSGYNSRSGKWEQAEGKAYFIGEPDIGRLKVSFFGPFYGSYNIIALDQPGYSYSMIIGPDTDYFWILSRTPELEPDVLKKLLAQAESLGVPVGKLIYPEHDNRPGQT